MRRLTIVVAMMLAACGGPEVERASGGAVVQAVPAEACATANEVRCSGRLREECLGPGPARVWTVVEDCEDAPGVPGFANTCAVCVFGLRTTTTCTPTGFAPVCVNPSPVAPAP